MTDDSSRLLERWRSWLRGRIRDDVYSMVYYRQVWVKFELLATVNGHDRGNNLFFTWVRESYLTSLAVGLRVQSDLGDRSVSLARMLHELVRQPQSITRQQYLEDRDAASERSSHWGWANKGFDELADEGGDHLDPRIPGADLEELLEHVAPIRKIVNTTIAHASPRARNFRSDLRPESLSVALELVLGLFKKYSSHLANVDVAEEWTLPAWWTIFREPWKEA